VPIAALLALGTAAATWAEVVRDPARTTKVACDDYRLDMDALSGDPVADCEALWRREQGTEPPGMVAYRNSFGGITVYPAGKPVPADWTRLAEGFRQDGRLIQLDESLNDAGAGFQSGCLTFEQATAVAERELTRLGLTGWVVELEPGRDRADGDGTCSRYLVDTERFRVALVALPRGSDDLHEITQMARSLQSRLRGTCVPVDAAVGIAQDKAAAIGLSESDGGVEVNAVPDPTAPCSSAVVNVTGRVEIIVRGPRTG
jgi:hypothetical protein